MVPNTEGTRHISRFSTSQSHLYRDNNNRKKVNLDEATAQTQPDSEVDTPYEESSTQMTQPDDKVDVTSDSITAQDEVTVHSKPNNSAVAMHKEKVPLDL